MDLIDLWWNASQQSAISELRAKHGETHTSSSTTISRQAELIGLMQQENDDLRLRVGVLIRLLIQQGAISADQYSAVRGSSNDRKGFLKLRNVAPKQIDADMLLRSIGIWFSQCPPPL